MSDLIVILGAFAFLGVFLLFGHFSRSGETKADGGKNPNAEGSRRKE